MVFLCLKKKLVLIVYFLLENVLLQSSNSIRILAFQLIQTVGNSHCTKKMKFSIKDFFSKCDQNMQETGDLVAFTEKILNGKPHILCIVYSTG